MSYRSSSASQPWILLRGNQILAVDSKTGRLVWQHQCAGWNARDNTAGRMLLSGDNVIVALAKRLTCLDRATGQVVGEVNLPFDPDTAVAEDGLLLFAALNRALCVTEAGQVVWRIDSDASEVRCTSASGEALWKAPAVSEIVGLRSGAIAGNQVCQPDLARS